ncbi:MAG: MFS transporter, partial [Thermoproteus sp.]|nr:MFS transporter [Thermoproteus sp.]
MMDARLKAILGAYLGWVMDGYDALLVVPILPVLGQEFFPGEYAYLGGLSTLVATLVMRPAGAVVMGYVGDKLGRRIGLLITTLGYSLTALLIAATPSYAQIGALAPAVVLALRAAQGLFLGGEWGPGTALIMEWSRWRGEVASAFAQTGYPLGVVAANLVYSAFSAAGALGGAGWRLYMATGAAAALLAFVVRSRSVESPAWRRPRANPLALLFGAKSADLAKAVVMTTGLFLVYYSTYLIYPTFLEYLKLKALAPSVMFHSTAAAAAAVFLGGALAALVGATPVFLGSL